MIDSMEFEQRAQEGLYARVLIYLGQAFGDLAEELGDEQPGFMVELGPTRILLMVDANGPDQASVTVLAAFDEGLVITGEVGLFLARTNHELPLSALCLDEEDRIWLRHILLDEAVTRENLHMHLRLFAQAHVRIQDELNMRFR
jgi:hypothetical protein